MNAIADPRAFADPALAPLPEREIYSVAQACLAAETGAEAREQALDLQNRLRRRVAGGSDLARLIANAPSVDVARQVWRAAGRACQPCRATDSGLAARVFAIPLVIVAGKEGERVDGVLPGTLRDPGKFAEILRAHDALRGNRNFALAGSLVLTDALDVARLPELLAWQRLPESAGDHAPTCPRTLAPAPIEVAAGRESVHLRFLVGTAIARADADLFGDTQRRRMGRAVHAGARPGAWRGRDRRARTAARAAATAAGRCRGASRAARRVGADLH